MRKELKGFSHERAIGDAMMEAQAYFTAKALERMESRHTIMNNDALEFYLERESGGWCETGSRIALYYLRKNYPDDFDFTAIIHGSSNSKGFPFHSRFLVHGTDGRWYSGSPANHRIKDGPESTFTNFDVSKDIRVLLRRISSIEQGVWPRSSLVRKSYKDGDVPLEVLDDKFKVIELFTNGKEVNSHALLSRHYSSDKGNFIFGTKDSGNNILEFGK